MILQNSDSNDILYFVKSGKAQFKDQTYDKGSFFKVLNSDLNDLFEIKCEQTLSLISLDLKRLKSVI